MVSSAASATSQDLAKGSSSAFAAIALGVKGSNSAATAAERPRTRWNVRCVAIARSALRSETVPTGQRQHERRQALTRNRACQRALRDHRPIFGSIEFLLRFTGVADDDEEDVVGPNLLEFLA